VTKIAAKLNLIARNSDQLALTPRSYIAACHKNCGTCHMRRILAFLKDDAGATAIEYGLIAAGISVVIIVSVNAIGSTLNTKFSFISTTLG
jgi:pilus assembly protein Flp/PilA